MKISLCIIVGNVQEYIERCLRSFAPISDEFSIVRAIGARQPDETEAIVRRLAAELKIPLVWGEYRNAAEHNEWPHIDNFAAARQASFDQASHELCFWCDSDDILKSGAQRVRQLASEGSYAAYLFPYDVFGKNVVVQRERMMLRSAGRWRQPVHEFFEFRMKDVSAARDDGVMVQHLPQLTKTGSNDRNLRILETIPEEELTPGLRYHLFNEIYGAKQMDKAIAIGTQLIADEVLGKDERYDVIVSLVCLTESTEFRTALLHEAHKTDPTRREALGVLACTMMDAGKPEWAMAYARQMMATPEPDTHSWNSRRPFYGYIGDEIYAEALRVNGKGKEAFSVMTQSLERNGGPKIALLHATRGRSSKAAKTRKAWFDLAAEPGRIEHVFAIDDDDKESNVLRRFNYVPVPAGGGCVRAWNYAALSTTAPILLQLSDDWLPVPQWDNLIAERLGDLNEPRVLAISDGLRADQLLCMAICTRAYVWQDWYLFHPWFTGVYSDNWFTKVAYDRGQVIEAKDIVFQHQHPCAHTGVPIDQTYLEQNAPERYTEGLAVFNELKQGRDWSTVHGWFNYWNFYEAMASRLKDGDRVVEIGCWMGRSIIYLAQQLKRLGKKCHITVVDTFTGEVMQPIHQAIIKEHGGSIRHVFEQNIARCGVADMIEIVQGDSAASAGQFADGSLDFIFIDAAHDYLSVVQDIVAWKCKVKPGGIISGHDLPIPDVAKAVGELVPDYHQIGPVWLASIP